MELHRFECFSEFQLNNFLTDIQITVINGTIDAHKVVLAASSDFFKALLNSNFCEEVSTGIINLPSVNYDVLSYIIDYIYMRNQKDESTHTLSFYIDIIEASDYLRMLDLISTIDSKIVDRFSLGDLCREFDRISSFPLKKTKLKIENQFVEHVNSRDYSELFILPESILVKIIESENFSIDENMLWAFFEQYFRIVIKNFGADSIQNLIDIIRPGLLDDLHFDNFIQFLSKSNFLWKNKNYDELKIILSQLPNKFIRNMDSFSTSSSSQDTDCLIASRTIPYLFINEINLRDSLSISKFSLRDLQSECKVLLEIQPDNFRFHALGNHIALIRKDWNLSDHLGLIIHLVNYDYCPIPHWQYQVGEIHDDYQKYWGFSLSLLASDLFLFGGCFFTHGHLTVPSNKIIKYNFQNRKWQSLSNIHLKVACWSSCVVKDLRQNGRFYISGGRSPKRYLKSFYAIDIETNALIDYPNLPFAISGHSMEMVNNFIVVYGGAWDGTVRYEILLFDLTNSLWRVVLLADIFNSVHVDYCCSTISNNSRLMFYDLRKFDHKSTIYSHSIDVTDPSEIIAQPPQHVMDLSNNFSQYIVFGRSTKLPFKTLNLSDDIFNNYD